MNPKSKHTKILEKLLKLPENKECADCRTKAPRWASINLGIFICLHCSGIHRSLGVHISKVRSTTLDTWLPEQVSYMQCMGNNKANAYWEAELPPHYDRGQIENFIRAKYVEKRWVTKDHKDRSPSKSKQELISSRSLRCYGNNELTSSRSARIYGKNGLASSRSSRRFGCVAEWTNSQHLFKERSDCSISEKDRAGSSPSTDEVPKDRADSKNQLREKKGNCQPSTDQSTYADSESVNGKPSKEPTQVVGTQAANGSLWKSEQECSKIKQSTANSSSKADYADELFRTIFMDDSVHNNDSIPKTNNWVRFDSDQESSTPKTKINSDETIHETKLNPRSGKFCEHQKDVANSKQSLSEKPNMVSPLLPIHNDLGCLLEVHPVTMPQGYPAMLAVFKHHLNVNVGSSEHTTGSWMPTHKFEPSVPYTMSSSLYRPIAPIKGMSTVPPARGTPAALPVSGYDYDFSYLTQGMFANR